MPQIWKFTEEEPINRRESSVFDALDEVIEALPNESDGLLEAMLVWSPNTEPNHYDPGYNYGESNHIDIVVSISAPYIEGLPVIRFFWVTKPRIDDFPLRLRHFKPENGWTEFKSIDRIEDFQTELSIAIEAVSGLLGTLKSQSQRIKDQQS